MPWNSAFGTGKQQGFGNITKITLQNPVFPPPPPVQKKLMKEEEEEGGKKLAGTVSTDESLHVHAMRSLSTSNLPFYSFVSGLSCFSCIMCVFNFEKICFIFNKLL